MGLFKELFGYVDDPVPTWAHEIKFIKFLWRLA